jgi:hypothetical protein
MNGISIKKGAEVNTVANLNWEIKGTGDFDGDGKADILWRNKTNGRNYVYMMNGASIKKGAEVNYVSNLDWDII